MAVMALFLATPMALAHERESTVSVVPINGQVADLTYGQWSARWWQYAFAQTTFDNCPNEPGGPMFFLLGTTGGPPATRSCTVPEGKHIIFPLLNAEQSVAEGRAQRALTGTTCSVPDINGKPIKGLGYSSLLACATAQVRPPGVTVTLRAQVDNQPLRDMEGHLLDLRDFEAVSPPPRFSFEVVAGNPECPLSGIVPCPQESKAAADGFWIILNPLSEGQHTVHFFGQVDGFTTETTYTLTVE
jgi:hypothetical protein